MNKPSINTNRLHSLLALLSRKKRIVYGFIIFLLVIFTVGFVLYRVHITNTNKVQLSNDNHIIKMQLLQLSNIFDKARILPNVKDTPQNKADGLYTSLTASINGLRGVVRKDSFENKNLTSLKIGILSALLTLNEYLTVTKQINNTEYGALSDSLKINQDIKSLKTLSSSPTSDTSEPSTIRSEESTLSVDYATLSKVNSAISSMLSQENQYESNANSKYLQLQRLSSAELGYQLKTETLLAITNPFYGAVYKKGAPCQDRQLILIQYGYEIGLVSNRSQFFTIVNDSPVECTLNGYPSFELENNNTPIPSSTTHGGGYFFKDPGPSVTTVNPAQGVYFAVSWVAETFVHVNSVSSIPPNNSIPLTAGVNGMYDFAEPASITAISNFNNFGYACTKTGPLSFFSNICP